MPQYLGRFSYTSESVKTMVSNPQDRAEAAKLAAEALGGRLREFWFSFGEFDGAFWAEMPDNTTAAALSMLVGESGVVSKLETTVLLTMDEAQEAMRKTGKARASYRRPARLGEP